MKKLPLFYDPVTRCWITHDWTCVYSGYGKTKSKAWELFLSHKIKPRKLSFETKRR